MSQENLRLLPRALFPVVLFMGCASSEGQTDPESSVDGVGGALDETCSVGTCPPSAAVGGSPGSGGSAGSGGSFSSGGSLAAGGSVGAGGGVGTGGGFGSGGDLLGTGGTVVGAGGSDPATGGALGSGGSNAATGGSDGSGGSVSGGCGVEPANPNTNTKARNLLCYLYEIYGENVLSGQQDCHWSASNDLEYINQRTGEYPAIVGGDFLYDNAVSQATSSWNAGGLSMIRYHMGRPEDQDSYESSLMTTDLSDTLTPGTNRYNGLMAKFDHAADRLSELQDAGVVVIWAPFHEVQPNGWFWWSKGTGDQLKQLWQLMFDNFTDRGLNNLIWLFPFSGQPNSSFYPPTDTVDLAGPDTYSTGQPYANMYQNTVSVVGSTIPIPLHEVGFIPNPADMFNSNQASWVLFSAWCDTQLRNNSDAAIQTAYSHARTLNRSDLPSFD